MISVKKLANKFKKIFVEKFFYGKLKICLAFFLLLICISFFIQQSFGNVVGEDGNDECYFVDNGKIHCENTQDEIEDESIRVNLIFKADEKEDIKEKIRNFKKIKFSNNDETVCLIGSDENLYCKSLVLNITNEDGNEIDLGKGLVKVFGKSNIKDIAVGENGDFVLAVLENGCVVGVGNNKAGNLGIGSEEEKNSWEKVLGENGKGNFQNAKKVFAGENYSCILDNENNIYCFGDNASFQIGTREKEKYLTPRKIEFFNGNVKDVFLAKDTTCIRTDIDELFCFGGNEEGILKDGTFENNEMPSKVGESVRSVSINKNILCYTNEKLEEYCDGKRILEDENIEEISVGNGVSEKKIYIKTSCGEIKEISSNKTIYRNENKNLCCKDKTYYKILNQEACKDEDAVESVCAQGGVYACDKEGNIVCDITEDKSKATKEICNDGIDNDCDGEADEEDCEVQENKIRWVEDVKYSNDVILTPTITETESNNESIFKVLNIKDKENDDDSVSVKDSCTLTLESVSAGSSHTCGIMDGNVYCWGYNNNGQLGNGSIRSSATSTPVKVLGGAQGGTYLESVTEVGAGSSHTCAISSGNVYCWGYNTYGGLGNGSMSDSSTPVKVKGGTQGGTYLESVTKVSVGGYHTCAISSGNVYCWGWNYNGQLGNGSTSYSATTTPVKVLGGAQGGTYLESVTKVSVGGIHTCAISGGNSYCWGYNYYGQLGNGSTTDRTTPVSLYQVDCSILTPVPIPTRTPTKTKTPTVTSTMTDTLTVTPTATCTFTDTSTVIPTATLTEIVTPTPTIQDKIVRPKTILQLPTVKNSRSGTPDSRKMTVKM